MAFDPIKVDQELKGSHLNYRGTSDYREHMLKLLEFYLVTQAGRPVAVRMFGKSEVTELLKEFSKERSRTSLDKIGQWSQGPLVLFKWLFSIFIKQSPEEKQFRQLSSGELMGTQIDDLIEKSASQAFSLLSESGYLEEALLALTILPCSTPLTQTKASTKTSSTCSSTTTSTT